MSLDRPDAERANDLVTARALVSRRAEAVAEMRACAASLAEDPTLRTAARQPCDPRVRAGYRQLLEAQLVLAGLPIIDDAVLRRVEAAEALGRAAARTDRWATIGFGGSAVTAAGAALWAGPEVVLAVLTIGLGVSFMVRRDAEDDRRQAESELARTLASAGVAGTTTVTELRQLAERRRAATEALDGAVKTCAALRDAEPAEEPPVEAAIAADAWEELLDVDAALLGLAHKHGQGVLHPTDVVVALERGDGSTA